MRNSAMQLTVLGCWAPFPRAGGACSGYLLQAAGLNILLDCGNGAFSNLRRVLDFRLLDAVVISHLHPDHYLDLFSLRHAVRAGLWEGSLKGPLPVYLPGEPVEDFRRLTAFPEHLDVKPIEELPAGPDKTRLLQLGPLVLRLRPARHSLPAYSMAVDHGVRFVYTGDTSWEEGLTDFCRGADLLLCEASGYNRDAASFRGIHLTAGEAGALGKAAGASRLLLTHFFPEYELNRLEEEAAAGYGGPVVMAREGQTYQI